MVLGLTACKEDTPTKEAAKGAVENAVAPAEVSQPAAEEDTDVGLYDPVAPDGSVFVRFINVTNTPQKAAISGKDFGTVSAGQVTDYFVMPQGKLDVMVADKKLSHDMSDGDYSTVIIGESVSVVEDTANADRAKATIAFYNLSDKSDITLKAKGGTVDVLANVGAGETKARDMNAVKIDFGVYEGDQELATLSEEVIERGNHYSVIYDGKAVKIVTAATNTRK